MSEPTEPTETPAATSENPTPEPAPKLPVVASLILLYGGASHQKRVFGARRQYQFFRVQGIGPKGAPAHVREYTDLATFHAEEADIRLGRSQVIILSRFGNPSPEEAGRAALSAVLADPVGSPTQKRDKLQALIEPVLQALAKLEAAAAPADEPAPAPEAPVAPESGIDTAKRRERELELRRAGETTVRALVKEYDLKVAVFHNAGGMLAAVLAHEETVGQFDRAEVAVPPTAPPTDALVSNPPFAGTPVAYAEPELQALPIEKLREIGTLHGIATGTRKALVQSILAKQKAA